MFLFILATLVGMKQQANIKSNLEVATKPTLTSQQFYDILAPNKLKIRNLNNL